MTQSHEKLYQSISFQMTHLNAVVLVDHDRGDMKTVILQVPRIKDTEYWMYQSSYEFENDDDDDTPWVEGDVHIIRIYSELVFAFREAMGV